MHWIKILFLLMGLATVVPAKSYYMPSIDIKATVLEDGSMHIEESRTYKFKGRFKWADYRLYLSSMHSIRNFQLREGTDIYSENDSENPGTYTAEYDDKYFYVKWHYNARNESRTFTLEYTLLNAVNVYEDIAELYYKFIGEANPAYVENVNISIAFPQQAEFGTVHAWAHGPLNGTVHFKNGNVVLQVDGLPKKQFVEARVTFPTVWVAGVTKIQSGLHHGRIMAEEEEYALTANERRRQAQIDAQRRTENNETAKNISFIVLAAALALFLFMYSKYGRGFNVNYNQKSDLNIPRDKHPALLNALYYNKTVSGGTLATTMFGLARKGYLSIEKDTENPKKWYDSGDPVIISLNREKWQSDKAKLPDFENELIDFMFNSIAGGDNKVSSKQLKKAPSKMQKWFRKWQKTVKAHLQQPPYYDKESIKATVITAIIMFAVFAAGLIGIITFAEAAVISMVGGLVLFGLSFSILRYTAETKELRKKISAFRNYLKQFSKTSSMQNANYNHISDYFLMAIALGIGKKKLNTMIETIPAEQQAVIFPWFIYAHGSGSPADFAAAVSSVVSVAGSSVSSAAGAGGGMAGGGGGGAGGAAGGAG